MAVLGAYQRTGNAYQGAGFAYQQIIDAGARHRVGGYKKRKHVAPRLEDLPNRHLDSILDEVEAQVLYRDIVRDTKVIPDSVREAVAPFTASEAVEPPAETINWEAVEQDVASLRALLTAWIEVERRKKRIRESEEWFLLGD